MTTEDLNSGLVLQKNIAFLKAWRAIVEDSDAIAFGKHSAMSTQAQHGEYATSGMLSGDRLVITYAGCPVAENGAPDIGSTEHVFRAAKTLMLSELDALIKQAETTFAMLGNNFAAPQHYKVTGNPLVQPGA